MPTLVRAGSGEDAGDVAWRERLLESRQAVPLDHLAVDRGSTGRLGVAGLGPRDAVVDGDDGLVDGAVVAVVVDEDLGTLRRVACEAHGEAVGVRRRERELPVLQAEAAAELGGHPERVLGREHGRDAAAGLLRDGPDRGVGRVAGHRARVPEAEVDVLVAVDAREARAVGLGDVGRERARPARHPVHGHAVEHVLLRALEELARAGVRVMKSASSRALSAASRSRSMVAVKWSLLSRTRRPRLACELHGCFAAMTSVTRRPAFMRSPTICMPGKQRRLEDLRALAYL